MIKPRIIKTDGVLEALFKGNDVLRIYYTAKGVDVQSLTKKTLETVRGYIEKPDPSDFFVEMAEVSDTPTEPDTPSTGEDNTEELPVTGREETGDNSESEGDNNE